MAKEIERKFLVRNGSWRSAATRRTYLRDGFIIQQDGMKLRIRFSDGHATLTFKGPRRGISRDEFEYPIPAADAEIMLASYSHAGQVEKTRHHILYQGFEWTVDEFHGSLAGTVFCEIELPSETAWFPRPDWVGREVTGQRDYQQVTLLRRAASHAREGLAAG
ncbi:CYTH domain-containing protein [Poseidonocella sp. HB161398]|uniref:CYTH domain-containing protein n=1 Tax=Poseidonocella sp. HB161398 TaxID=2320855 RepID=UPI001107E392|nr:CYTH domain-containing protein [Poseidonocella sp. HB161398]